MSPISRLAAIPLSALLCSAAIAGGHDQGPPEVKARNAHMALYSYNMGILGGMAQEKIPYDAAAAAIAAANLAAVASMDQSGYWTEGTDNTAMEGTRALPAIWSDMAKFDEINASFAAATAALATTAGDGLDALKAGIGEAGAACGTCHKAFRGPR